MILVMFLSTPWFLSHGCAHFEQSWFLYVCYIWITFLKFPTICSLQVNKWILVRLYFIRTENICQHKNLYVNIDSSIIYNSEKVEKTQMSINRWMDKQNIVYWYKKILFNNKKAWNIDLCYDINETWKNYAKWRKLFTILCCFIYINCQGEANP